MYPAPSDREYGAKGGGRDDGAELQAWLDANAGRPVFLDDRYWTGRELDVRAGTTIHAWSPHIAGIHAHASLPAAWMIKIMGGGGVTLNNISLIGTPELRENKNSIALEIANSDDVRLNGCNLSWFHHLITPAATKRLKIYGTEFHQWSNSAFLPEYSSEEGQAIIAANAELPPEEQLPLNQLMLRGNCLDNGGYGILGGNGDWPNEDAEVVGCKFHSSFWTAIDCLGPNNIRWKILNTDIWNVHECGIYLGVEAIIDNVTIIGVPRRDCSAHCIEGGGYRSRITNCKFISPFGSATFFTNPIDFYYGHNICVDACEEYEPGVISPWASMLHCRNIGPVPDDLMSDGLMIEENDLHCNNGKLWSGIYMYDGGGGPFRNVTIRNNRRHGQWTGPMLYAEASARGHNFNATGEL